MSNVPPCDCATPGAANPETCYCSVENLLRILRRRYSLAVMRAIHNQPACRYHDVAEAIPDASSSTLAEALHALEAARLLARDAAGAHRCYRLTESGVKLLSRLRLLLEEVQTS